MTITEFSLNKEFENLVRQMVDEQEQATVIEEGKNVADNDESAKKRDFFQDNNAIKKNKNKKKTSVKP